MKNSRLNAVFARICTFSKIGGGSFWKFLEVFCDSDGFSYTASPRRIKPAIGNKSPKARNLFPKRAQPFWKNMAAGFIRGSSLRGHGRCPVLSRFHGLRDYLPEFIGFISFNQRFFLLYLQHTFC